MRKQIHRLALAQGGAEEKLAILTATDSRQSTNKDPLSTFLPPNCKIQSSSSAGTWLKCLKADTVQEQEFNGDMPLVSGLPDVPAKDSKNH